MSPGSAGRRPSVAYLSYSSGEFDARSLRMARAAIAAGWQATIYARLEPGHPDVEDLDGIRLIRVPADWRTAIPGLRWWGSRRGRAELRRARRLRDRVEEPPAGGTATADGATSAGGAMPAWRMAREPVPRAPSLVARLLPEPLRSWVRNLIAFPVRPLGWARSLDEHVGPADIWHGMWVGSLPAIDRQRRRLGGHAVYDSRDVYMLARDRQALARPVRSFIAARERAMARRADQVVTVNDAYAGLLVDQLGVTRPVVVMNCPDPPAEDQPAEDRIRATLGLDGSTRVVLYQGQLITERGIEQAMDAILDVPKACLVLLGYGPLGPSLRAAAAAPPYAGKVHVLPAVPPGDLLAWTASADVTVIPIQPTTVNHRYSTPQKLFESLAAGVPVVASDLPGMAGIVRSGGIGVLCDPTTPAAIAAALREVLDASPEDRAALRARIRAAARERYSWTAQAATLLATYDRLLGVAGGEGPPGASHPGRSGGSGGWWSLARRLGLGRVRRAVLAAASDGAVAGLRHPGRSLGRARAALDPGRDRLRAEALAADRGGEPGTALALWTRLGADGDPEARRRARLDEGTLRETDPTWLPGTGGGAEVRSEPAAAGGPVQGRVLHLVKSAVPERWSGYTIRTLNNVRAQRDAGLEPIVVTEIGWPRVAGVGDFAAQVEVDGVSHLRLDRGPGYDPRRLPNDVRLDDLVADLRPLVRDLRPELIQAHSGHRGGDLALVALALRDQLGIPVAYEARGLFEAVWSADDLDVEHTELFTRRLVQETRILHEVDGILVISEALADLFADRGIQRERMHLLPNGIDPAAFVPREREPALRHRLGLEGRFVVGYVGNLDHRREGIDVLIRALAELRRTGRDVAVLVVGDGDTRPALERLAAQAGVADACRFTGRVPHDEIARYYAQIDLFANPRVDEWASRYITPLKPFEAMALGLPVLVSDLPALREVVDPPHRGVTTPPGDPVGLADAIARLQDDPGLRGQVAAAGAAWVRAERTWAANGARYVAAYEAILAASR